MKIEKNQIVSIQVNLTIEIIVIIVNNSKIILFGCNMFLDLFKHVLAICCKNGSIQSMRRHDDPAPIPICTGSCPTYMEWANSKEPLRVAGPRPGRLCANTAQTHSDTGQLAHSTNMPQSSVSFIIL
uniref:Uncharacterized protein n=1 Tax=Sipha flava TaxID=143950 RepID=A0A2S2Q3U0_9HEMI